MGSARRASRPARRSHAARHIPTLPASARADPARAATTPRSRATAPCCRLAKKRSVKCSILALTRYSDCSASSFNRRGVAAIPRLDARAAASLPTSTAALPPCRAAVKTCRRSRRRTRPPGSGRPSPAVAALAASMVMLAPPVPRDRRLSFGVDDGRANRQKGRGSGSAGFGRHKARGNRRPLRARFRWEGTIRRHGRQRRPRCPVNSVNPVTGWFVSTLAEVLPEPSALHSQPACRALGQKPAGTDDQLRPSALAHPVGPGTASAPASLARGGWPPPAKDTLPAETRPSQAGGSRAPYVTQNRRILNHARNRRSFVRVLVSCCAELSGRVFRPNCYNTQLRLIQMPVARLIAAELFPLSER